MKKKVFTVLLVFVVSFFMLNLLHADETQKNKIKITGGAALYDYHIFWKNSDFNKTTNDKDDFDYMHLDFHLNADFGNGVSLFASLGTWGQFGQHPVWGVPEDPRATMLQGYINVDKLIGPFSVKLGKVKFLYGDGLVAFDGGEDGTLGANFYTTGKTFDFDLFYKRPYQGGGIAEIYYNGTQTELNPRDEVESSIQIFGAYPTIKLSGGKYKVSPYIFYRWQDNDKPLYTGIRAEFAPTKSFSGKVEYVKMSGNKTGDLKYKGYGFLSGLQFSTKKGLFFGVNYNIFSGDDPNTNDYETYSGIIEGPFTNGFYKWWPGLGPAHLMTTGYGFSCIADWNATMTNLNVFDAYVGYSTDKYSLRATYWSYSRNKLQENQTYKAMGNELSFFGTYNIRNLFTVGASVGYWSPGEHFKKDLGLENDASGALGGFKPPARDNRWFVKFEK
jgi:hypothetical protein